MTINLLHKMLPSKEEIEKLVHEQIAQNEKLGHSSGGSGHLGCVSYTLDKIDEPTQTKTAWEVHYHYTIVVETEFTYYPDNPPYETPHSGVLILKKEA
ncbi:MAG: hypothetical protein GY810_20545 [Aureispira sp.]|nr:hypothetical protein [Aureispira sp.]